MRWTALSRGRWTPLQGSLSSPCVCGQPILATLFSASTLGCKSRTCPRFRTPVAPLLPQIAFTPLPDFFKTARNAAWGTRGNYPILHDFPCMRQAPILHCTSKFSKFLLFFALSILSISEREQVRFNVHKVMGRSNLGGMYLREFGRLVAHITAVPGVLGVPMDPAVSVMLSLSQLLAATWRRAVSTAAPNERRDATVALRLAASLLGPLYARLKPFDPETKGSAVFNLYLHTSISHVGGKLGRAFPPQTIYATTTLKGRFPS